jgi:hypothetical protein
LIARDMSFYFSIIGTKDNPLFEHEFGTSKQGGDGVSRFRDDARRMNPFIVHSSLDILEDVQWGSGAMYVFPLLVPDSPPRSLPPNGPSTLCLQNAYFTACVRAPVGI